MAAWPLARGNQTGEQKCFLNTLVLLFHYIFRFKYAVCLFSKFISQYFFCVNKKYDFEMVFQVLSFFINYYLTYSKE